VLGIQLKATKCEAVCVPAPESEIVIGEFAALLSTVKLPDKLPTATGENVASNVADCPGVRIRPDETPLSAKCPPETLTFETVTLEFPALVTVTLRSPLLPTATFPKLKLEALVVRSAVAAIPVPLKVTVLGELETSVITETLPEMAPAALGEKITLNVACFPAAIVRGSEIPVIVTPAAAVLACVTVRFDPPLFDMVTDWDAVSPSGTEPKPTDAGATEIVAAPGVVCWLDAGLDALVRPMQPELIRIAKNRRARAATEIAFWPVEFACSAHFSAPRNHSFRLNFFIAAIVEFGKKRGLLS
jgi:hypothetical protein